MKLSELRQRPHLSASQINQLLNICSLQWYFERVEKLKKPFVSHALSFGSSIHRTLESALGQTRLGTPSGVEFYQDMFSELWKKENEKQTIRFPAREDYESLADKGRNMIQCFLENIDPVRRLPPPKKSKRI